MLFRSAQVTPPAPEERPRIRTNVEVGKALGFTQADLQALSIGQKLTPAKERRIAEEQFKDAEARQAWQKANPRTEPRPKRNRATQQLAENVGIPAAGVPEPEVVAEIVDRLPAERVVEEVNAEAEAGAIEYPEAEKAAEAVTPEVVEDPDKFYDADQSRPLEALESEHRPTNQTAVAEQRPSGGGEHEPAGARPGQVPERGGPSGPVGGPGERAGGEAGEGGDVEHAVAAAGGEPGYQPEPAAEPGATGEPAGEPGAAVESAIAAGAEPVGGEAAPRRLDSRGNPIFAKGERVVIPDGEALAGRHGTVEEATGLVFQSVFGGQRSEPSYSYEVRTDSGSHTLVSKLEPEVGERPAYIADVRYGQTFRTPQEMQRTIANFESKARNATAAVARARTERMKGAHRADARCRHEHAEPARIRAQHVDGVRGK